MKTKFLVLFIGIAMLMMSSECVEIKTYSIEGDIEFINKCSGDGAHNPTELDVRVQLWYESDSASSPSMDKREKINLVRQGNTHISKGTYTFSDVPTNMTAKEWRITFPDACAEIPCEDGTCVNRSTNTRQPIRAGETKTSYDYRYSCTCE